MNDTPKPKRTRSLWRGLVAMIVVAAGFGAAYVYGPQLIDAVRASQYTPSARVSQVEQRVALTNAGRRTFYATAPVVEPAEQFNASCQSTERTTAILGCYHKDKIYLYDVQNTELDGALEVTAAHELLHAVYARLTIFEKQQVDKLIQSQYEKVKDNNEIKSLMQYYKDAEPGQEINELHSIIGTTVPNLDSELERYYAKYFNDRGAIVVLNQQYTAVFARLEEQAETLRSKIDAEEVSLNAAIQGYENELSQLNSDIQSFNQRATGGEFTSRALFNSTRAALMARVSVLDAKQQAINARVSAHNAMIQEYNNLAVRAHQLNSSINGVTPPSEISQ